ncbi:hypothetical protein PIIN_03272 [Serendipita indica DSM 11827]|uniref:DRBM domain-containing protein n=1 Tax=Serendipita indica (strain DSM 11827) TaxID=1109443 RepID=G4TDH1_SERID|nr:hypothetical protein PIIN_03272 [Serendipita indica DSM 11827]
MSRGFQQVQQSARLAQGANHEQLLMERLNRYSMRAKNMTWGWGPHYDRRWAGSFWIGSVKIGASRWWLMSKDAAKEDAARDALLRLDRHGYH